MKKQSRRSLRGVLALTALWGLAVAALLGGLYGMIKVMVPPDFGLSARGPIPPARAPGIQTPPTLPAAAASVPDNAEVIGVSAGGHDRAYLVEALSGGPPRHVVNDLLGEQAISVTYCDFTGCSRAFTGTQSGRPLELDVGGFLNRRMALRVKDKDYDQATGKSLSDEGGDPLPYKE
jgi:hypothetical protein